MVVRRGSEQETPDSFTLQQILILFAFEPARAQNKRCQFAFQRRLKRDNPMKASFTNVVACSLSLLLVITTMQGDTKAQGQMPDPPGPEIDILKKDVGEWTVEIKAWPGPGAEPVATKGKETTKMLGGYWSVTNFEGNMMGMDFQGRGTYGYDTKKKKYVGTWIDSLSPYMMQTAGDYDKDTQTLTMAGDSPGPDGTTMFHYTMTTCYKDDGRVMTMHMQPKGSGDDQKFKLFEMTYKKMETKEESK